MTNIISEENPIKDKLIGLYTLQLIDSKTDEIRVLRGELPIEVEDLEDEIAGLEKRVSKIQKEISDINDFIGQNQAGVKESEQLIAKYDKQLLDVKNNREYDALNKELEMQRLSIQLANKKMRDAQKQVESHEQYLHESEDKRDAKLKELAIKKKELEVITAETEKEEQALVKKSKIAEKNVEERLLNAYKRTRGAYRNGLGVVLVERDACGGCFGKIPPQRQLEVQHHKKIILCEHCSRILIDEEIQMQVEENVAKMLK
ncbi:MAG: C4-type zinc ribbon domain-containing protein [Chitinophagales bacterium]